MEASGLEPIRPRAVLPPSLFTQEYRREGDQYLSTWYESALGEVTEGEGTGEEVRISIEAFYRELGTTPEEVGLGYLTAVTRVRARPRCSAGLESQAEDPRWTP